MVLRARVRFHADDIWDTPEDGNRRGVKMRRYAAAGIPYDWIVVPRTRSIEEHRLSPTGYDRLGTYGPGDTFRPELFPGLDIPVDSL